MRGDVQVQTSEKVIPPILEYDGKGNYRIIGPNEVIEGLHFHPYKAMSADFNEARLADLEIASLYSQLQHFPTLPLDYSNAEPKVHPLAEMLYASIVYLKPTAELQERLKKSVGDDIRSQFTESKNIEDDVEETVVDNIEEKDPLQYFSEMDND